MEDEIKALIVDDERDVCFLLSNVLKNRNIGTNCVNSIADAKSALLEKNFSIVFLDNRLPDGLGLNFVDEIRRLRPGIKIIMITAHDTRNDSEKAYLGGVDFFIGKPFNREMIYYALERFIKSESVNVGK